MEELERMSGEDLQQLIKLRDLVLEHGRKKKNQHKLTKRDFDILEFIQDQKFATLEALFFAFFDSRTSPSEDLPRKLFTTRQRLLVLKQMGLLESKPSMFSKNSVYLLSQKGVVVLRQERPSRSFGAGLYDLDIVHFRHDEKVTLCRIAIEKAKKSERWFSERRLKSVGFEVETFKKKMPHTAVPDGIFISSKGKRVAFEIECSPRKKSRFQEKAKFYQSLMREREPIIEHVLWVAVDKRIYADLKESIPYGSKDFSLEPYSYFLNKLSTTFIEQEVVHE